MLGIYRILIKSKIFFSILTSLSSTSFPKSLFMDRFRPNLVRGVYIGYLLDRKYFFNFNLLVFNFFAKIYIYGPNWTKLGVCGICRIHIGSKIFSRNFNTLAGRSFREATVGHIRYIFSPTGTVGGWDVYLYRYYILIV